MEVRIRLQKAGKSAKKRHNSRIVAISRKAPREGRVLEILGYYDPAQNPALIHVDHDKIDKWIQRGAQMTETVRSLVKKTKKKS